MDKDTEAWQSIALSLGFNQCDLLMEDPIERDYPEEVETKEEPKDYPPKNSWGMIKPPETTQKEWVEGYKAWKEKQ